jgi:hypothetical protein
MRTRTGAVEQMAAGPGRGGAGINDRESRFPAFGGMSYVWLSPELGLHQIVHAVACNL